MLLDYKIKSHKFGELSTTWLEWKKSFIGDQLPFVSIKPIRIGRKSNDWTILVPCHGKNKNNFLFFLFPLWLVIYIYRTSYIPIIVYCQLRSERKKLQFTFITRINCAKFIGNYNISIWMKLCDIPLITYLSEYGSRTTWVTWVFMNCSIETKFVTERKYQISSRNFLVLHVLKSAKLNKAHQYSAWTWRFLIEGWHIVRKCLNDKSHK